MSGALTRLVDMEDSSRVVRKPSFQTNNAHRLQDPGGTNGVLTNYRSCGCTS